jgi:secondary thiamine-phosphate synthase enzyme
MEITSLHVFVKRRYAPCGSTVATDARPGAVLRYLLTIGGLMERETLRISTAGRRVVDLTERVREFVHSVSGDGLLSVFAPHATAGLALMETGSGSERDLEELLVRLVPRDDRYAHRHGSVGHGGDHLLPVFVAPSITVPVIDGTVALGTWQSIVLVDPNRENNERTVTLSFVAS